MKRVFCLLLFLFCLCFVLSDVDVDSYTVETSYIEDASLEGEINLTIEGGSYEDEIYSDWGHSMSLGDFLEINGEDFFCLPDDCSVNYDFSNEEIVKEVFISDEVEYVGFYLEGDEIEIEDFVFSIDSNFVESSTIPLSIVFFDKEEWIFDTFSDSYLDKNWGCYDEIEGEEGALIGDSFYCEMITIPNSGSLRMGAKVGGSDTGNLTMVVYPEDSISSWDCEFDPNSNDSCEVFYGSTGIFNAGDYQVCIGADDLTSYRIYVEEEDTNCGFVYGDDVDDSVKDYAIFVQTAKYASANSYAWDDFDFEDLVDYANDLIDDRYDGSCEDGCVLPMSFYGVSQEIEISDIKLTYTEDGEWEFADSLYDLDSVPASVDFEGVWDLGLLEFEINDDGEFELYLGDDRLFEEDFDLIDSLSIVSVLPLSPPYGVSVDFYATLDYSGEYEFTYYWDFGDGVSLESSSSVVEHQYNESGEYVLTLGVEFGDYYVEEDFDVYTISPNASIASNLANKLELLEGVEDTVSDLPSWYGNEISDVLNLDSIANSLANLAEDYVDSDYDEDYLFEIAQELFALVVPSFIRVNAVTYPYFVNNLEDVEISPIETLVGSVSGATNDLYAEYILTWQNKNIDVEYTFTEFYVDYDNAESSGLISVYDIDIVSSANEESYFVIDKRFSDLIFNGAVGARDIGDYTVVEIGAGEELAVEFYYEGVGEDVSFFVSPALSSLTLDDDIDEDCNYNEICEPDNGETWQNCRSDCKPVGWAIFWFILGFFILVFVYLVLQVWYKRRYESYLFQDSGQLYNLLMYISNARARGQGDLTIEKGLRSRGWNNERIDYAMKKSRGKKIGMWEIIPIEKFSAWIRNRKARKNQARQVATVNRGNVGGNFNKSSFPRRF